MDSGDLECEPEHDLATATAGDNFEQYDDYDVDEAERQVFLMHNKMELTLEMIRDRRSLKRSRPLFPPTCVISTTI